MYVKMMGYIPARPQCDDRIAPTPFRVWQRVEDVNITHAFEGDVLLPDRFKLEITYENAVRITVDVIGPVYILNDQGRTIETFDCPNVAPNVPWWSSDAMPAVPVPSYIPPAPRDAGGVYSEG
jgi:hypothetical protein